MTKEQIEFRKAFHAGMDAGVVYGNSFGDRAYRDDGHEKGPYLFENRFGVIASLAADSWERTDWLPLPAEPAWKPEPFERVICRDQDDDNWRCGEFSHEGISRFSVWGLWLNQIAPYAGNEDCVGTTKPAKNVLKK